MGEAILIKALGGAGGSGGSDEGGAVPTIGMLIANGTYTCTKSGNYMITCIGGGGGSGMPYYSENNEEWRNGDTGNTGNLKSMNIYMTINQTVDVIIGKGGTGAAWFTNSPDNWTSGETGGTTTFGTMISATGGAGGIAERSGGEPTATVFWYHNNYIAYNKGSKSGYTRIVNGGSGNNKANGWKGCVCIQYLD